METTTGTVFSRANSRASCMVNPPDLERWLAAAKANAASGQTTPTGSPTPIPLRTLATLLNYERCTSHPDFQNAVLKYSDAIDPELAVLRKSMAKSRYPAFTDVQLYTFGESLASASDALNTVDRIAFDALPGMQTLSRRDLETIYYTARSQREGFRASMLFQAFFDLCAPDQQVSIQIKNETPLLMNVHVRRFEEYVMRAPKVFVHVEGIHDCKLNCECGWRKAVNEGRPELATAHSVVAFADLKENGRGLIIDMTRIQFGEPGRGQYGEPYFLGTNEEFLQSSKICDSIVPLTDDFEIRIVLKKNSDFEDRHARECASRAWRKWQNRETEGWCAYCGVGAALLALSRCGGCKQRSVLYCCQDHQKLDWLLHKMTCERVKKEKVRK